MTRKPTVFAVPRTPSPILATPSPRAWRTRLSEALYPTAYVAERAEAWLEEAARGEDPFLLVVSFPDPHHPFTPPGRYWDLYNPDEVPMPATFDDKLWDPLPGVPELAEALAPSDPGGYAPIRVTGRQAREAIALTYGMIAMIDDAVGRVCSSLDRLGLGGDTVLAFTSDHGDYLGDRGVILKFGLHYREVVRVPFLWRDPAGRRGSAVDDRLAGTIDIGPTVLARAGLAPPHGVAGRDLFGPNPEPEGLLVEDHALAYLRSADAASRFVSLVDAGRADHAPRGLGLGASSTTSTPTPRSGATCGTTPRRPGCDRVSRGCSPRL